MALTLLQRSLILRRDGTLLTPYGWGHVTYNDGTHSKRYMEPTPHSLVDNKGYARLAFSNVEILESDEELRLDQRPSIKCTGGILFQLN